MKRSALVSRLGRFGLLLALLCVTAPLGLAQGGGGVAELLSKHDEALKQHDLNGIMALFAPGPKTVVLGTGPGEKYQGAQKIREAYGEIFKDFDKGTLTHNCYWKDGAVSGNMARSRRALPVLRAF